jgi:hypothetical protein
MREMREQLDTAAGRLGCQLPKVRAIMREAADGITTFADFPVPHQKKICAKMVRMAAPPTNAISLRNQPGAAELRAKPAETIAAAVAFRRGAGT